MTDVRFVAITVAVSSFVTALPALIVSMKTHKLVNGASEALKAELAEARAQIATLSAVILRRGE